MGVSLLGRATTRLNAWRSESGLTQAEKPSQDTRRGFADKGREIEVQLDADASDDIVARWRIERHSAVSKAVRVPGR